MKPFIPIYCRLPNKLIRYDERRFDDGHGHTGVERVAVFFDKKKRIREMTAQIIWDTE